MADRSGKNAGIKPESIGRFFFWLSLIVTLIFSWMTFCSSGVAKQLGLFLYVTLPLAFITGILFVVFYLPGLSDSFAFGLLFPRKYLEKAPLILSTYQSMLANGNYEQGYQELAPLVEPYIHNPDLIFLYAQFCFETNRIEEGFQALEEYFGTKNREKSFQFAKILFYYADQAVKYQHTESLSRILRKECKSTYYTDLEKNAVKIRLNAIEGRIR